MTDTCWPVPHVTKISHTQMQQGNIVQEGLNSLIPLTQTIHENY